MGHLRPERLPKEEQERLFSAYFSLFPWTSLPQNAEGFDLGCGSGRWAELVAPRVRQLHCIDASEAALNVTRRRLTNAPNVSFHLASVDAIPLRDQSQDFGYSIGVLHHVPDTLSGLMACVRKLKIGAPFLLYIYYRFDNRPIWYQRLWQASDAARRMISALPFWLRRACAAAIAALIYWPLARSARLAEVFGTSVEAWPVSAYRHASFYSMRTDALDRFGTRLEQRFTRLEIEAMMRAAGLDEIQFRNGVPYWVAVGRKSL